ncbi:hypothetical protein TrST_g9106 [Triparma strigata]|uniref:Transcriptional adapter n=1 Tax=Triparma strigata TaxID=1606541 RepID=A0A9W7A2C7_9STRA|nr:hypothetical protein TrST_g9106 [Triparma strigata]
MATRQSLLLPLSRPLTLECDICHTDISSKVRLRCGVCPDFDMCLECFVQVQESKRKVGEHEWSHCYRVCDSSKSPLFTSDWSLGDEILLLESISQFGLGNWSEVSDHVSRLSSDTKTPRKCMEHYLDVYLERHGYVLPEKYHDDSPTFAPPCGLVGLGETVGSSTNRDLKIQASLNLFKRIEKATEETEKEAIREEARRMDLTEPFNVDDIMKMQGYDLTGFMPRRREFDVEWEQDAEVLVGDMEFLPKDTKEEREMKLKVLRIYNGKLAERGRRKEFVFDRGLLDYKKMEEEDSRHTVAERDMLKRARMFARFQTKEKHEKFTEGLLQAAKMREEIARLKVYQQMGFTTEAQVKAYEEAKKERLKALNAKRGRGNPNWVSGGLKRSRTESPKGLTPVVVNVKGTTVGADPLDDPNMKHHNKKIGRTAEEAEVGEGGSSEVLAVEKADESNDDLGSEDLASAGVVDKYSSLVSPQEASLCSKLSLPPPLFLKLKTALISEAVSKGFINSHTVGKIGRVKVNVTEEQEKQVFEFCLTAGWINTN